MTTEPLTDNFEHQFLAGLIAGRRDELADEAARQLIANHPDIEARYLPLPHLKWRDTLRSRFADLAAAVGAGEPDLFGGQIAWTKAAFIARGVPVKDLQHALTVVSDVLRAELVDTDVQLLEPFLAAGAVAADSAATVALPAPTGLRRDTPEGMLGARYLLAVLEGDRLAASDVILQAARDGMTVLRLYSDVLVPVQRELGRMWHQCEINVAEEHFGTATTAMVMAQLQPLAQRKPRDGRILLAACVEGDMHDLGLRMIADFFEIDGWRVICLGASVPATDIAQAARFYRADLVALTATMATHLDRLHETIRLIRDHADETPAPKIIVGGGVFSAVPRVWKSIGADAFAENAEQALQHADALVPPPPRSPGRV